MNIFMNIYLDILLRHNDIKIKTKMVSFDRVENI